MNHERSIELIHGDLDGELSPQEQDELHACLAADPSLSALRKEMQKLHEALSRVEAVDPPPELRARILAAIRPAMRPAVSAAAREPRPRRSIFASIVAEWPSPALFRYAAAAAFGAAVVAVGLKVSTLDTQTPADTGNLVGTMTSYRAPANTDKSFVLDTAAISGSVGTSIQNGMVVVDFDLSATQPVEIIADYSRSGLAFSGFAQFEEASASVESGHGRVRFTQQDAHQYAMFFSPAGEGSGAIEFQFLADGELIRQEALEVPATGRK